jgi:putative nucleotidyltransferase with HDIG domain
MILTAILGLALSGAGAIACNDPADWRPGALVGLLLVLAAGSDAVAIDLRGVRVSGSFLAIVLAMALLGPAPAVALGAASSLIDGAVSRRSPLRVLGNTAIFMTFSLVGALAFRLTLGSDPQHADGVAFAAVVLAVFMGSMLLNFAMVAGATMIMSRVPLRHLLRALATALPSEFATALLTAGIALTATETGVGAVGLAAVVIFIFQYILRTSVHAHERGEELAKRTTQLASLQVGLLSTVLQTLSMRDAMTARHSAAVARYSRKVAAMLGLDEREQDLIHTAALLHDIGKFILPDSVLFAERKLTDEEWELIKLHPEQGAKLVERIEGYGPVAEIVLHHHERFSGGGYPAGIAGTDIPLGSRIISAADTYDVMTSRDSYRRPVSSEAALAELRRVAGTQLDPQVVEAFEQMIVERRVQFSHTDEADFETELAFETRVADYARPRTPVAA